jgi:hypothetical protein
MRGHHVRAEYMAAPTKPAVNLANSEPYTTSHRTTDHVFDSVVPIMAPGVDRAST